MISAVLRHLRHIEPARRQNHLGIIDPDPVQEFFAGGAGILFEQLTQVDGIQSDPLRQIFN